MRYGYQWRPYVPVGQKKARASKFADKLAKKQKRKRRPIEIEGRKIAKSFWGKAWCDHLESLSDYSNRLPRGATYVRNGSVVDLVIKPGRVNAVVAGSDPYKVAVSISKLGQKTWRKIKQDCSSSIDSLIDLLGGRLSDGVMHRLTEKKSGCFPSARQIEMDCSCPDWSTCCKHIAAVMYAIGSRLDSEPELLFLLRGVDQTELIGQAVSKENLAQELTADGTNDLAGQDLNTIFGIELAASADAKPATRPKSRAASKAGKPRRKVAQKKASEKKKPASREAVRMKTSSMNSKKKVAAKTTSRSKKTGVKKKKAVASKIPTKKKAAKKRNVAKKKVAKSSTSKTGKRKAA